MNVLRKAKENPFPILVAAAYAVLLAVRSAAGLTAVQNSAYYIREMLLIMPVIFVLTALLDVWVPKEKIMRYLGQGSKAKGALLSLLLGSISAGPIYAAFPLCTMLHKKGASIRNLVIILSAWAVIKVPMLLNEMAFLGLRFMAIRWVLTVLSILVFSWMTARVVQEADLPHVAEPQSGLTINRSACIGCALCARTYPELFAVKNQKAVLNNADGAVDPEKLMEAISGCPVSAIVFTEDSSQAQ